MPYCCRCKRILRAYQFNKCRTRKNGLQHQCRKCQKKLGVAYSKSGKRKIQQQKWREKNRDRCNSQSRMYAKKNREKRTKIIRKYRRKYPEKYNAQYEVKYALVTGKLKKMSCVFCGKDNVHAHHENYNKPFDVWWLCPNHHNARHLLLKGGEYE